MVLIEDGLGGGATITFAADSRLDLLPSLGLRARAIGRPASASLGFHDLPRSILHLRFLMLL